MGRKSKADERRLQIIRAFYHCVVDQGAANASIRKIAGQAGVQPSTLHHYFSNREEIIEEAVAWFADISFEAFQARMASAGNLSDSLDTGLEFIFSSGMISDAHTGFFLECCVAARHNRRVRQTLAKLFQRFRDGIVDHLALVPGFSRLPAEQKALLASTVVAVHEGIELQWFADPSAVRLDKTLEITRTLIRFFIDTAGTAKGKK